MADSAPDAGRPTPAPADDGIPAVPQAEAPGGRLRTAAHVGAGAVVTAVALVLNGQLPGVVSSTAAWMSAVGAVECGALSLRDLAGARCGLVGIPVGGIQANGILVTALGSLLERGLGLSASWAYATVGALLMAAGVWGVVALARRTGLGRAWGIVVALAFLVSPSIQNLSSFGSTFWGGVLLPAAVEIGLRSGRGLVAGPWPRRAAWSGAWLTVTLGLLLVDGYAFVMAQATVMGVLLVLAIRARRAAAWLSPAAHLAVVGLSYVLFGVLVPGAGRWGESSIDSFRAMGADLLTLMVPSPLQWWAGAASQTVDPGVLWGDGTNASSNYLGFLVAVLAVVGAVLARRRAVVQAWVLVTLAAVVLSLGPSLKVGAARGPLVPPITYQSYLMPADAATATLPTTLLYEHVPGLTLMRATYRWLVLGRLGLLLLAANGVAELYRRAGRRRVLVGAVGVLALVEPMADPGTTMRGNVARADMVALFDEQVVAPLAAAVPRDARVVFGPSASGGNDYLANYLAPLLRVHTYNVGGDKSLEQSRLGWPMGVHDLLLADGDFSDSAQAVLEAGEADVVVVPFFDLRWSAYAWPTTDQFIEPGLAAAADATADADLDVTTYDQFAVVELAADP